MSRNGDSDLRRVKFDSNCSPEVIASSPSNIERQRKIAPIRKDGQTLNTKDVIKLIEEMKIAIDQKQQQYYEVDLSKTQHLKQVAFEDKMLEDLQHEIDDIQRIYGISSFETERQKTEISTKSEIIRK
ncbi:MAG: hypothetical protein EZS28_001261 [Streblomastix strix]|uniref:Uncharacterized protein n=1 Tax=Streblomastix strix TaxID=222440 RepID=A0A5J4X8L6_9EUKA|nr:MAG: hypothetical protein EZS28_001261 [Streblomastix strix]